MSEVHCEALVLGGGITGALIGHRLIKNGVDVVLADKQELGIGSTAASTGLLQYEIDTPLSELIAKVGVEHAVHAYRRGLQAIDELEQLASELPEPCGFTRRSSLYFASRFWHVRRLHREFECRKAHGFPVRMLTREELRAYSSIDAPGAIASEGDAQVDPYRFTQSLLKQSQSMGLRAFAKVPFEKIEESPHEVTLTASTGRITAKRVIYATGYDGSDFHNQNIESLSSTYAVASEPIADFTGWPKGCLIWETARPYFYARQTDDGRALIGGQDTAFSTDHKRDALVERQVARLVKQFHQLFPAITFRPDYTWAGTFASTKDGLAYIGQLPERPRAYFALGYGGNGITFSMIAARLIADLYAGQPNADADVFRFGR